MLATVTKWLLRTWIVLCALALILFLVGTFGLFGQARDPLAGVFLVPLGLPWVTLVDTFPEPLWPWLGAAAPLVNIALLYALARYARRRETP
jgi:drug/metabolite transporter superfamily protein YnfA